jgi:hypothetical protein
MRFQAGSRAAGLGPLLADSAPVTVGGIQKVASYEALLVGVAIAHERRIPCPPTSR